MSVRPRRPTGRGQRRQQRRRTPSHNAHRPTSTPTPARARPMSTSTAPCRRPRCSSQTATLLSPVPSPVSSPAPTVYPTTAWPPPAPSPRPRPPPPSPPSIRRPMPCPRSTTPMSPLRRNPGGARPSRTRPGSALAQSPATTAVSGVCPLPRSRSLPPPQSPCPSPPFLTSLCPPASSTPTVHPCPPSCPPVHSRSLTRSRTTGHKPLAMPRRAGHCTRSAQASRRGPCPPLPSTVQSPSASQVPHLLLPPGATRSSPRHGLCP